MSKENNSIKSINKEGIMLASYTENYKHKYAEEAWHFSGKVLEIDSFNIVSNANIYDLLSELKKLYANKYDCLHILPDSSKNSEYLEEIADHEIYIGKNNCRAFEIRINENCPMSPIKMVPCFRHGSMTPWGGEKLKTLYNKDIPDSTTGESMELSAIPALNSKDPDGTALEDLQRIYGLSFIGNSFDTTTQFPLLIKLLDAKGLLSIQVHPDDEYAHKHENGKLGKEEAWVVLDCEENSKLIYGLKPNTKPEDLSKCLKSGESPEKYMNYVCVKKGDVLHIAPGTVHALGSGIVVYEVQQSSDVTYRLWDWARKDKNGKMRPLHIDDSINCIKYDRELNVSSLPSKLGINTLLDVESFILYVINIDGRETIKNNGESFITLTSLTNAIILSYDNRLNLLNCDTAIVPANISEFTIEGKGMLLMAKAKNKK